MTGYTAAEKFKYWLFQDKIPLTKLLILSNVVTFLLAVLFRVGILSALFTFRASTFLLMPWTAVTYPFVWATRDPISLLFSGYWLWVAGGSLERSWGTARFAWFFFTMCAISALGLFAGALAGCGVAAIGNLWVPLAGLTVAFAMLNPEQQILFFFVIPLKLKYLALLSAGLLVISFGLMPPLGLFALFGCAYAYWYVKHPVRYSAPRRRAEVIRVYDRRKRNLNPFTGIKDWNDRRKLKKLFDRSYGEDDERNNR